MAPTACASCNRSDFQRDHQTGELVCQHCGAVAEESRIVSEVSFSETSAGKAVVTGQYVSHDQAGVLGNSLYGIQAGESRHQTIEKARQRMERIGHRLAIPDHIVESGLRFFRTALANNFVKGRKSQHVLSACLYLSCRLGKTDHMLMDFAELMHVNVFNIGATYLQLIRNQKIKELPIVDPTVYIQRFTSKLQFGPEGARRVVNDAKLLVQRMGKDWLQQGRRPAGVAAACILLAARMNNFRRSKAEIVLVAKIAEETLQRRLDEFKNTSAGTLTVQDFRGTNVESAADPPSYTRHRELEKKMAERLAEVEELRQQGLEPDDAYLEEDMVAMAKELDREDGKTIELTNDLETMLQSEKLQKAAAEITAAMSVMPSSEPSEIDSDAADDENPEAEDTAFNIGLEAANMGTPCLGRAEKFLMEFRKRRAQRESAAAVEPEEDGEEDGVGEENLTDSLSDVDDDEIEAVILTEEEIELKSKVWMSINREYLLDQERKRLRQEADVAAGIVRPSRKRRRPRARPENKQTGSAEANAANMMKEKAHSKKINYAAVKELFAK